MRFRRTLIERCLTAKPRTRPIAASTNVASRGREYSNGTTDMEGLCLTSRGPPVIREFINGTSALSTLARMTFSNSARKDVSRQPSDHLGRTYPELLRLK